MKHAKNLMLKVEDKLFEEMEYDPKRFPDSPGGCAYQRVDVYPDHLLDFWHPVEKALYPKYFALREKRKKEFEEFYVKEYGPYKKPNLH